MEYRKLIITDKKQLDSLIATIESTLDQENFWLPINSISSDHFFDDSWTCFYGVFDNAQLIASAALFFNIHEFGESLSKLNLQSDAVAEIGRAMVHPQYRGANLLYNINTELVNIAHEKGVKYLLATIHPQNIPSQKSFLKLGMKKTYTYTKANKYVRDIYMLEL